MQCVPLHVSASHKYNRLSLVAISCILTPFMSTVSSHPVSDRISVPAADSTFMINELRSSTEGCSRHMPARRKHRKWVLELLCSSPDRRSVHHPKQFFSNFKEWTWHRNWLSLLFMNKPSEALNPIQELVRPGLCYSYLSPFGRALTTSWTRMSGSLQRPRCLGSHD